MMNEEFIQITAEFDRFSKIRNRLRSEASDILEKINKPNGVYRAYIIQRAFWPNGAKLVRIDRKLRGLNSLRAGLLLEAKKLDQKLRKIGQKRRVLMKQM